MHTSVNISTANNDRVMLSVIKYVAECSTFEEISNEVLQGGDFDLSTKLVYDTECVNRCLYLLVPFADCSSCQLNQGRLMVHRDSSDTDTVF